MVEFAPRVSSNATIPMDIWFQSLRRSRDLGYRHRKGMPGIQLPCLVRSTEGSVSSSPAPSSISDFRLSDSVPDASTCIVMETVSSRFRPTIQPSTLGVIAGRLTRRPRTITCFQRSDPGDEFFDELVMNCRLYINSVCTDAGLPGVAIHCCDRTLHCRVYVGVVEHDEWRASTKLQGHLLDLLRTQPRQDAANFGRSCKRNLPASVTITCNWLELDAMGLDFQPFILRLRGALRLLLTC